ncbi:methylmalonyl Co-A mutase-associated GTPase MeaB [Thermoactinomyces sp. AMNI-1]|uniref:Methylmalonyl Co-A mutase-associated GTPase MeaB n=2 Tax=Thermoactinomyces mirandus TaxID=2756294 RepID=A0A7W1XU65_9BACL|nr:methylmalonyl Co-A mutase-associated GTPase MeaB [Thermoactinomyces mirandus]
MGSHALEQLLQEFYRGSKMAAARIISLVERNDPAGREILKQLYSKSGQGYIIGITGPAGSGKSTLTDSLVKLLRQQNRRVGVVAVDPTSPFTGGALLGDRVRMGELSLDSEVFIRSMGTRGNLGGLSWAARDALVVLDAFGCDYLFVETVGAGQSQVDVARVADTVIMVDVPGLGDDIQAAKAGIMEIGDIFVVNKADRGDADKLVRYLQSTLELGQQNDDEWQPPVLKTIAWQGTGVEDVLKGIMAHRRHLEQSGLIVSRRKQRLKEEVILQVERLVQMRLSEGFQSEEVLSRVYCRELDPWTAAKTMINSLSGKKCEARNP